MVHEELSREDLESFCSKGTSNPLPILSKATSLPNSATLVLCTLFLEVVAL